MIIYEMVHISVYLNRAPWALCRDADAGKKSVGILGSILFFLQSPPICLRKTAKLCQKIYYVNFANDPKKGKF